MTTSAWLAYSKAALLAGICALGSGCRLDVSYTGTTYACSPPDFACPTGQVCVEGFCQPPGGDGGAADAPAADAPPGPPDAAGPRTLTFGETNNDDVTGVTHDTYLDESAPAANFGASDILDADATPLRTALLRFDLSSLSPGTQVLEATLVLWTPDDALEEGTMQLFVVEEAWTEGDQSGAAGVANFTERTAGTPWTTAGAGPGSRAITPVAEFTPATIHSRYEVPLPAALVEQWIDAPAGNAGLAFAPAGSNGRGTLFHSSESAEVTRRPRLVLTVE